MNNPIFNLVRKHRRAWIVFGTIVFVYIIIRLFFIPPLMDGVPLSRAYYDRNGTLMRLTLSADDKYRLYTPLAQISPTLQRATILYEDKYFYYHPGVNPVGLIRGMIDMARSRPHPAGASTITMQVARIKYGMDTRRPIGKIKQVFAALYIDAFHSKREILEAYLNLAPYGANIEGAAAASIIYFHRRVNDISPIESITLATIPQNPTKRGLNTDTGIKNIMNMRHDLVARWVRAHPDDENLVTLADMPLRRNGADALPFAAPHFINYESGIAHRASEITTTIDLPLQNAMEKKLKNLVAQRRDIGITNAAAILVNYKTMDVLSYIGSVDYFDASILGQNDGVRAKRSPGSTLKPLIYAAAVDQGLIHGMTLMKDAKINFGVYAPENSDNEFFGPVLAHDALTHSRNIPAINLVREIGTKNFYKLLTDAGVTGLKKPSHYGISIALGGAELSMMELAEIYATMANMGEHRTLRTSINQPTDIPTQLLSPEAFFIVMDMLAHQSQPSKHIPFARNQISGLRHYWKTGTSSSYRDAWTAGIFGDMVLIVWVGNFDGQPNNAFSGARAAAPIYFGLADTIGEYFARHGTPLKNNNFLRDDMNIALVDMCDAVGGLAGEHCPKSVPTYFIPGVSPIDVASVYRAIPIDNKTGRRACTRDEKTTHMAVYEFWDAEYIDMFRRAGVIRKTPPPFMDGCNLDEIATDATPPIILSPIDGTRMVILDKSDSMRVTLRAISENTDAKIFWFIDDKMVGTTKSGNVITTTAPMGTHTVRAMDEMGTGTSANFDVVK